MRPDARAALNALDQQPMSPRQRYAAILVALGEFIDGYDLLVIGAALIFLRPAFHLTPAQIGALGASGFLGAMVGLLIFGDLSDRLGRRAIFVANLIFFVIFSILSAFINSLWELFAVRFLVGVGIGMDIPTSTAYLAEIAPARHRGKVLGSLSQVTWILGALTSTLVAVPLAAAFGQAAGAGCSALPRSRHCWCCSAARACPNRRAGCSPEAARSRRAKPCAVSAWTLRTRSSNSQQPGQLAGTVPTPDAPNDSAGSP